MATIVGTTANETLTGTSADDTINGGDGDDSLLGGDGYDFLYGDAGNDTLRGQGGWSAMFGGAGDDLLIGGDDFDGLAGDQGNDTLDGGGGDDILRYTGWGAWTIDLEAGTGSNNVGTMVLISIEDVQGTVEADLIAGSSVANTLYGNAGNDTLRGAGGDDVLVGSAGSDNLDGGAGFDQVQYYDAPAGANVNLATGLASDGFGGQDTLAGFEAVRGSFHDDTITGSAADEHLDGDAGDDRLLPGTGVDTLDGGAGIDLLVLTAPRSSYQVSQPQAGVTRLFSAALDVDVRLSNIENVQFSDGTRTLAQVLSNSPPQRGSAPFTLSAVEDQPRVFTAAELLVGFSDPDGDALSLTLPSELGAVDNGDGSYTYTPPANFSGSFFTAGTAIVSDGRGGTLPLQLGITVTPVNDAPLAVTPQAGVMPVGRLANEQINGISVRPDGSLLVGLSSGFTDGQTTSLRLVGLDAAGQRDPNFGDEGEGSFTLAGFGLRFARTAPMADGRFVVAATASDAQSNDSFLAMRFAADGSVDAAFNGGIGHWRADLGTAEDLRAVEVDDEGRILVTGWARPLGSGVVPYDTPVIRLREDGTPDTGFSGDGITLIPVRPTDDRADAIVFLPDDRIVIAGRVADGGTKMFLLRLEDDGSVDTSFGSGGSVLLAAPGYSSVQSRAAALLPDGSLLVAGFGGRSSNVLDFVMTRVSASGVLDASFGNAGWAVATRDSSSVAVFMQLLPDGDILLIGTDQSGSTMQPMLARFDADGRLDSSFGDGGIAVVPVPSSNTGTRPAVLADGSILLAVSAGAEGALASGLVRLRPDGSLDESFGGTLDGAPRAVGQPFAVSRAELLSGWVDVDDDEALDVTALASSSGGVAADGDGRWIVTPASGAEGPLTLSYTVSDGQGGASGATRQFMLVQPSWLGTEGDDQKSGTWLAENFSSLGGNDRLDGGAGDDTLSGGDGQDLLRGGAGNDMLHGDDGPDIADYRGPGGAVVADLAAGVATQGGAIDQLASIEALFGSDAADRLRGADQAPAMRGDTLRGGPGNDTLEGGGGVDAAEWLGPRSQYTVTRVDDTTWAVRDDSIGNGDEGRDTLAGIERLVFADQMLSFGTRAEEVARVAFVLWSPAIVGSPALFARGISFYDVGYDVDTLCATALQFWTADSDLQLVQRLIANSGSATTTEQLLLTIDAHSSPIIGRAAALREIAFDAATTALIEQSGIRVSGLISDHFVPGFGNLFGLLPSS